MAGVIALSLLGGMVLAAGAGFFVLWVISSEYTH